MRISSGCFKSTPISTLKVITEEPPLHMRRDQLSLKYFYKVKAYYKTSLVISSPQTKKPYMLIKIPPSASFDSGILFIQQTFIVLLPSFSYHIRVCGDFSIFIPNMLDCCHVLGCLIFFFCYLEYSFLAFS